MDSGEKGVATRSEDRSGWIVMLGDEDADKFDELMRGSLSPATGKEVDSMVVVINIDGLMAAVNYGQRLRSNNHSPSYLHHNIDIVCSSRH